MSFLDPESDAENVDDSDKDEEDELNKVVFSRLCLMGCKFIYFVFTLTAYSPPMWSLSMNLTVTVNTPSIWKTRNLEKVRIVRAISLEWFSIKVDTS
jgi:hypothetical protein